MSSRSPVCFPDLICADFDDLPGQLHYPVSDSDTTSAGSPTSPIFPPAELVFPPSLPSYTLPIDDDVRHIISRSPAAMKYCKGEVVPAFPHRKTSSHSARRGAGYIPRPPNAFFLFRSTTAADEPHGRRRNDVLSREAGVAWGRLSEYEQEPFHSHDEL